jgi:hypothetical protein
VSSYFILKSKQKIVSYVTEEEVVDSIVAIKGYTSLSALINDIVFPFESALFVHNVLTSVGEKLKPLSTTPYDTTTIEAFASTSVVIKEGARTGIYRAFMHPNNLAGSSAYVVEFRHPLVKDKNGKYGRKIKKGLGTDKEAAQKVVDALNTLLSTPSLWDISALRAFRKSNSNKAVEIFLANLPLDEEDVAEESKRNQAIEAFLLSIRS